MLCEVISAAASAPAAEQPSAPAPFKKEEIKESKTLSPAKAPAHIVFPPTEDRIFTSPLARELAEENNVRIINSIRIKNLRFRVIPDLQAVTSNVIIYLNNIKGRHFCKRVDILTVFVLKASGEKEATASTPKTKDAPPGAISGLNYEDIPVTQIRNGKDIAISVEDEDEAEAKIAKFKGYTPQNSCGPAPPKKEQIIESKSLSPAKAPAPIVAPPTRDRVFASPLAGKLAEENNVSVSSIKGTRTGPDGCIVKADVEEYLASRGKEAAASTLKTKGAPACAISGLNYTDIPVTQIRKVTASSLLLSKQTIPHYYLTVDAGQIVTEKKTRRKRNIDAREDKLMDLREKLNSLQGLPAESLCMT
ncbi:hypothetical protein QQ045_028815 [Rhodiola kirilowii]